MSYGLLILISVVLGISMGIITCLLINLIFLFKDKRYIHAVKIGACFICLFGARELLYFLDEIGRGDYPDDIIMQGAVGISLILGIFGSMFYMEKKGIARWKNSDS